MVCKFGCHVLPCVFMLSNGIVLHGIDLGIVVLPSAYIHPPCMVLNHQLILYIVFRMRAKVNCLHVSKIDVEGARATYMRPGS